MTRVEEPSLPEIGERVRFCSMVAPGWSKFARLRIRHLMSWAVVEGHFVGLTRLIARPGQTIHRLRSSARSCIQAVREKRDEAVRVRAYFLLSSFVEYWQTLPFLLQLSHAGRAPSHLDSLLANGLAIHHIRLHILVLLSRQIWQAVVVCFRCILAGEVGAVAARLSL